MTSVTIPNSVMSIEGFAFGGCSGLIAITVDAGNKKYDSRNNCNAIIETASNTLIAGCKNTIIPSSVTVIGEGAFLNCSGLTSVTIPSGVTSIGNDAFSGCSSLKEFNYNATNCANMGTYSSPVFAGCSSLNVINIGSNVQNIPNYAFCNFSSLTSIDITIPYNVVPIYNYS